MTKYKLIRKYPGGPEHLGYELCSPNYNGIDPACYPEFWEPIVEKNYKILNRDSKDNICEIERLADGEIFSIGDTLKLTSRTTSILKFNIISGKLVIALKDYGTVRLDEAKKYIEPLFTTEDGVDMFRGNVYYVVSKNFIIDSYKIYKEWTTEYLVEGNRRFSTREAAEDYLKKMQPKFTGEDMVEFGAFAKCSMQMSTVFMFDKWLKTKRK